ncbi:INO80 complex subunit D-B [Holothuria leucospilota]|uniref:INO80 complex subunit D-B n=1 Tax=Holothuria leucospilota TaxID=206669 RepID=A0A9Q1BYX2_HOLLE|nr:INO80 complex subunit D-B [Holothuria leucospilota]
MYEGKNIHLSEDNKLLCSFSAKQCKQRRINGFGFCIRHVLEDKSAPFRQCAFVAKYNRLQCTNAIPISEQREYCNSHMQVLGLVPKRSKKRKRASEQTTPTVTESEALTSSDPSKSKSKHKKKKKKKRKREKHKSKNKDDLSSNKGKLADKESTVDFSHLSAFLPNGSNTLPVDIIRNLNSKIGSILPNDKSVTKLKSSAKNSKVNQRKEPDNQNKLQKLSGKDNSTSERTLNDKICEPEQSDKLGPDHFSELRAFSQLNTHELLVKEKPSKAKTLFHEKINTSSVDSLRSFLQERENQRQDLYPLGLEYSDSEDSESDGDFLWRHRYQWSSHASKRKLSINGATERSQSLCSSLRHNCQKLKYLQRCDRYNQKSRKDLSKRIIQSARAHPFGTTVSLLRSFDRPLERPTLPNRTERICCSKENGEDCQEEVVPFARHCFRHILEDENQMLFYQCAAEFPGGLRCIEPCFDVINEHPLCIEHAKTMRVEPKLKKPKKKTKPFALTKPFRKRRNHQKKNVRPQKPIPPAEPIKGFTSLPSFSTKFTASQTSPSPTKLDSAGDIADKEMSDILDRNLGLSLADADLNMVNGDEASLDSNGEEEDLSKLLPNINEIFGGKNGDVLYTKEDADVLEKLFEVSEQIKLDMDVATVDGDRTQDDEDTGIGDVVGDDLPSDLQSAANKLMEDMRGQETQQNGDVILPPNTVPSTSSAPSVQPPVANQAILNALAGPTPCPPNSFSPSSMQTGQEPSSSQSLNTAYMPNSMFSMNPASAMLHMAAMSQQIGLTPGMPSPHGQLPRVPAPAMSPHNPHLVNNLPQHSPQSHVAGQNDSSLLQGGGANQTTVLPSFRQIWNTSPLSQNILNRSTMANGLSPHSTSLDASGNNQMVFQNQISNTAANFLQRHPFPPGITGLDPTQMMKAVASIASMNGTSVTQPHVTSPGQFTSLQQALLGTPRLNNPQLIPMQTTSPIMSVNNGSNVHNVPPPKT